MPSAALARHLAQRTLTSSLPRLLMGPPPTNDRGARLDPEVHTMLTLLERSGRPHMDQLGPERARQEMARLAGLADVAPRAMHRVEDRRIEGPGGDLALRIYTPRSGPDPRPATVYLHGGGFVVGGLASHDGLCRFLADRSGGTVVSVDYRLAPEHPFPAAVEDAVAAFDWVRSEARNLGLDPSRVAVAGDSAGGNLAAVVCQQMREAKRPMPCFQLLIYPACDLTRSCESHRTFARGYFLDEDVMDWFCANYLTDVAQETDPRGSPLAIRDPSGLPAAHVVTAGFDPLRDEGEAYADALRGGGVAVSSRCYESLIHGFATLGGLVTAAGHAVEDLGAVLHDALAG